jgi:hypothetical protein
MLNKRAQTFALQQTELSQLKEMEITKRAEQ